MNKCLYVGHQMDHHTGGGVVTNTNKELLAELFADRLQIIELQLPNTLNKYIRLAQGYMVGLSRKICRQIELEVQSQQPTYLFLNGSLYGQLAHRIKAYYPQVKIVTFMHNIEYNYIDALYQSHKSFKNRLNRSLTYRNEAQVIRNSDLVIVLNHRDQTELKRVYGRVADTVISLTLKDQYNPQTRFPKQVNTPMIGLFLGSNFFPNYNGIRWFAQEVAPHIDAHIKVVGKGFIPHDKTIEISKNIDVIGFVEQPADYYDLADFIISPIFEGSGMKTKTAEALMYGKTIYATTEAFEGYEIDYHKAGALCNTSQEFIEAIQKHVEHPDRFNSYNRQCYLEKYDYPIALNKMRLLLAP